MVNNPGNMLLNWLITHQREYPGAPDRGGSPLDGVGYVALLSELKDAFTNANPWGGSWGLSCKPRAPYKNTIESSYTDFQSYGTDIILVSEMVPHR